MLGMKRCELHCLPNRGNPAETVSISNLDNHKQLLGEKIQKVSKIFLVVFSFFQRVLEKRSIRNRNSTVYRLVWAPVLQLCRELKGSWESPQRQ